MDQNSSTSLKTQALIEHLILQEAIEIYGIDNDTGEMIYLLKDKLKLVDPKLYGELKEDFERHMFKMIDRGPESMKWTFNAEFFDGK